MSFLVLCFDWRTSLVTHSSMEATKLSFPTLYCRPFSSTSPRHRRRVNLRSIVAAASGGDHWGKLVDENMIALRLRIREMKISETNYEPPLNWMEWEKQYFLRYNEDISEALGLLQNYLMNTRPESEIVSTQSSSSAPNDFVFEAPSCWCGSKAPLKTSHTIKNPGRKFFACPNYKTGQARKCEFFVWADILHLLEENIRVRESKVWKMWDDVLVRENEVRDLEDKVRERETTLHREKQKLLCLYWVVVFVIILAWFG